MKILNGANFDYPRYGIGNRIGIRAVHDTVKKSRETGG